MKKFTIVESDSKSTFCKELENTIENIRSHVVVHYSTALKTDQSHTINRPIYTALLEYES